MFLFVTSEILGLFGNILTADHKHSLCNTENLLEFLGISEIKDDKWSG